MDDVDAEHGRTVDDAAGAARALERVVDPVVAVADGTVTYANAAARDAFGIGDADRDAATALGTRWDPLAAAIDETTVGTARRVALEGDRDGARVHRGADGATITVRSAPAATLTRIRSRSLPNRRRTRATDW